MSSIKKIHFMGIGGSGESAAAMLAARAGYEVSGCDIEGSTAYSEELKNLEIIIYKGHDLKHLKGVETLVVVPSVYFQKRQHPELRQALRTIPVMTWQEFLGKNLQKDRKVVCIAGTHGKSTTTAMVALLLQNAGFDPSAVVGAMVKEWKSNNQFGRGEIFAIEADEFYNNFLNYTPDTVILNNIEFDHPDFFHDEEAMFASFKKFIEKVAGSKNLIVNQDSPGIKKLFTLLGDTFLKTLNLYGYTQLDTPEVSVTHSFRVKIVNQDEQGTSFTCDGQDYFLSLPGTYNVANAAGVIVLGKILGIGENTIRKSLKNFHGLGRRMEFLGEPAGIKVYDDYAHHPTAIRETLGGLRQLYPQARIWCVYEAHSFSRTKALLSLYLGVFDRADKVLVGPIFKARDNRTFGMTTAKIIQSSGHKDGQALDSIDQIKKTLKKEVKSGDVVIVMGAGKSYLWAREILKSLA